MNIEAIKAQHKDKWLAIDVHRFSDDSVPEDGELIAEADDREELWRKVPRDIKRAIYVLYSGSYLEEGYAAAF